MDREKVFEEIEDAVSGNLAKAGNVYKLSLNGLKDKALIDAMALLKEQKAVEPEMEHSGSGATWWNVCGNCKTAINPNDKFCHECGRPVLWEGIEFAREFMSDAVHETAKQFRR